MAYLNSFNLNKWIYDCSNFIKRFVERICNCSNLDKQIPDCFNIKSLISSMYSDSSCVLDLHDRQVIRLYSEFK